MLSVACAKPGEPDALAAAQSAASEPRRGADETAWHWRSHAAPSDDPTYVLGVMGQTGIEHCPDGRYEPEWLAVRPVIGRVSVSGPDDEDVLEPLMGQPVLAIGRPGEPPAQAEDAEAAAKAEPCPPAQMRSDWRTTPRGMLFERDPAPTLQHLRMDAVRPLHELQVRKDGDHLVVTLINPVPVALSGVELRAHYEGCFGKPHARAETVVVGELGVGAQASARVHEHGRVPEEPAGRDEFRAYSVQLVAQGEGVVLDLDVPLAALGIDVRCPND